MEIAYGDFVHSLKGLFYLLIVLSWLLSSRIRYRILNMMDIREELLLVVFMLGCCREEWK